MSQPVKTRWFAIKTLLWGGDIFKAGSELPLMGCDMGARECCGEVLGCRDDQHVAHDPLAGKWVVRAGPVALPLDDAEAKPRPPAKTVVASSSGADAAEPVSSMQPATPAPQPEPEAKPEPEPDAAPEPEPKPKRLRRKRVTRARGSSKE